MRYPRHMTLELTAKCNFRCPYCYCVWHEYPALAKPELDLDQWKAVLDQCAADDVDDILFTGGEALLRSDMFAILDHARRILPRARLSLFTNASRLDETLIKRFRRRKVHLATSLQGLRTYGAMTGTRRSYRRLLAVVARASELKWPIAVSITVTKANLHEAADMFVAAALSGAKTIQVGPVILGGRAAANQELMVSRDEWEAVKRGIRALPDARVPYTFCDEFICSCRADTPAPLLEKWEEKDRKPCPAGKSFGVLGPNGLYRTCLHSLPR
ncbi:MAG: radical SAM protein [Kiritimatiellae bacterium]|nr:radical SAM protein [Kiritimatiellia bacterium]MBR2939506.1 radical SAM protein [Kiritimatiellia bacterium]